MKSKKGKVCPRCRTEEALFDFTKSRSNISDIDIEMEKDWLIGGKKKRKRK